MTIAYASTAGASLASGGSASLVISKPSGTVDGDLLLCFAVISANVTLTPVESGWNTTVNAAGVKGFWRVASSEPASFTFTRGATTNTIVGTMVRVTGAHPTAPIDTASAMAGASTASIVIPTITVGTGTFLLEIASSLTSSTFTPPSTTDEDFDAQHATQSFGAAVGHEIVSAGATGTRTWTATVSGNCSGIMWSIIPGNGLNRAATLYPTNVATVDTGTGIDVRLLASANRATNDATQSARATNTQDSVERTFDPATAAVTNTNNAATTMFKMGWGLRLTGDMTPVDDTNCDSMLTAGTLTVTLDATAVITGNLPLTGNLAPTWRASLWKYNPSTDTGTLIAAGASDVSVVWNCNTVSNDTGVYKTVTISVVVASAVTFAAGEVLMLQLGLNTNNIPNPLTGTMTIDFTIRVDSTVTKVAFAAGQSIHQICALANSAVGAGIASLNIAPNLVFTVTGDGVSSSSKAAIASKSFSLIGDGVSSRDGLGVGLDRSATGDGISSMTRVVVAAKAFTVTGDGVTSRGVLLVTMDRIATGDGVVTILRTSIVSKSFTVTGDGVVTEVHPVQAFRTFSLVGNGEVVMNGANASSITLPIDDLPDGGGTTVIKKNYTYIFD